MSEADWNGGKYKRKFALKYKWRDRNTGEVGTGIKEVKVPGNKHPKRMLTGKIKYEPINATPKGEQPRNFNQAKADAKTFKGKMPVRITL